MDAPSSYVGPSAADGSSSGQSTVRETPTSGIHQLELNTSVPSTQADRPRTYFRLRLLRAAVMTRVMSPNPKRLWRKGTTCGLPMETTVALVASLGHRAIGVMRLHPLPLH